MVTQPQVNDSVQYDSTRSGSGPATVTAVLDGLNVELDVGNGIGAVGQTGHISEKDERTPAWWLYGDERDETGEGGFGTL